MGFKFKRVDLVAGSEEWPTGTTDALRQTRSEVVVKKCAQAIVDSGCGWILDTSKNATINDVVAIPSKVSGVTFPGLFLTNPTSGCKLFMAYFGYNTSYSIADFSGDGTSNFRYTATATSSCSFGLCMSMIPAGSSNTFGDPTTTTFIPVDAVKVIGTVQQTANNTASFGGDPVASYVYSWGLFCTSTCICVACAKNQNMPGLFKTPSYAIGKIFGTLSHSTDSNKYGCVYFRKCTASSNSEGLSDVTSFQVTSFTLARYVVGMNPTSAQTTIINSYYAMGEVLKSDGTWVNGCDASTFNVVLWPANVYETGGLIFNTTNSGKCRWTPYAVAVISTDIDTYGIVPGDGMKGYLDTDLFRCAIGTYGQTFDNGNFICVDDDCCVLLGWDSTNTDQIAGN